MRPTLQCKQLAGRPLELRAAARLALSLATTQLADEVICLCFLS